MSGGRPEGPDQIAYDELRARLDVAEETLRAIRQGEVDALVVDIAGERRLFTLEGADHFYRVLIEGMPEGAAVLDPDGTVVYANARLSEIAARPLQALIGQPFGRLLTPEQRPILEAALTQSSDTPLADVRFLVRTGGERVPVALSLRTVGEENASVALIVTDLSTIERAERARRRAEEQYEREHLLATGLQRALGPDTMPDLDWVTLSGVYRPGIIDADVGGDWYDAIALSEGQLALVVGDVAGRGLPAAVHMAELRISLRAYLHAGKSPAEAMRAVNELAGVGMMATVFCAVLDADHRSLRYVNAGHPPPLILDPAGPSLTRCEEATGPPVGVGWPSHYREIETTLPDEATLVLYTDGLIEIRGESLDAGLGRLAGAVTAGLAQSLDQLAGALTDAAAGDEDDRALLLARLVAPAQGHLTLTVPATAGALSPFRGRLRRFLLANGISEEAVYDLILAASEIAANATEHAYDLHDAQFACTATVTDSNVTITVSDHGRWRAPRHGHDRGRGRGLRLAEALVDRLDLRAADTGTKVVIHRSVEQTVR